MKTRFGFVSNSSSSSFVVVIEKDLFQNIIKNLDEYNKDILEYLFDTNYFSNSIKIENKEIIIFNHVFHEENYENNAPKKIKNIEIEDYYNFKKISEKSMSLFYEQINKLSPDQRKEVFFESESY